MFSAKTCFTPCIKKKKGCNSKLMVNPFPCVDSNKKYEGVFTGMSVEVCTKEDIIAIYDNGFYGKGSQSRSAPQSISSSKTIANNVEESLSLGLEEAFFLAFYLKVLKISDLESTRMDYQKFLKCCLSANVHFIETLASYVYLKSNGWVVKSGLKFGGDYLIYRKGPRFYHASFVVNVSVPSDTQHLNSKNLKGLQRIAETSDKDVLILELHTPNNFRLLTVDDISKVQISETIIRRFNCSYYAQTQKQNEANCKLINKKLY